MLYCITAAESCGVYRPTRRLFLGRRGGMRAQRRANQARWNGVAGSGGHHRPHDEMVMRRCVTACGGARLTSTAWAVRRARVVTVAARWRPPSAALLPPFF